MPGGRGSVLAEYEPMGSHGDPIHDHDYRFLDTQVSASVADRERERDLSLSARHISPSVSQRDISG